MPAAYYSDKLYPFMDAILALIGSAETDFYLTGGTALSRHYLHHRYSDDLDLFVNGAEDFREQVKKALEAMRRGGIAITPGTAADTFVRIFARSGKDCDKADGKNDFAAGALVLKIDFVNDVAFHYGDFQEAPFYPRIDHWRNILSNKLCALSRREPKDMADILAIAGRFPFSWREVFREARQKDLWVDPIEISRMIQEFPEELLKGVKWAQKFDPEGDHAADATALRLEALRLDIFHGRNNSLSEKR